MALSILYYTISTKNPRKTSQVMQNPDAVRQGFISFYRYFICSNAARAADCSASFLLWPEPKPTT